ncbi:MAG: hypothetical protein ACLVJH_18285 [Faecalibacterium prausnitzii]
MERALRPYALHLPAHRAAARSSACRPRRTNPSAAAHTRILEAVLRGSEEDLSRALSDHLNRYKLSVEQARQRHRSISQEGDSSPGGLPHLNLAQHKKRRTAKSCAAFCYALWFKLRPSRW